MYVSAIELFIYTELSTTHCTITDIQRGRTCNLGDDGVTIFPEDLGETTVAGGPVGRVSGLGDDRG